MRVLVLTNMYPSAAKPWFGIFVREQVEDLEALGVETGIVAFDGTSNRLNYVRGLRSLRGVARRCRFDLVHAHYGLTGAVALMQRRLPVVTTFHGGDYTGLEPWHVTVSRIVARFTTPVVVSSEGRMRLRRPDAAVIPAGVDTSRFRPTERASARRQLGWNEQGRYALHLGARGLENKRVDLFDAALDLARAAEPGLSGVSLEGLSRDEVVAVMNAVDVSVMTSDTEGSPVAVRESLACATPVVSVQVGDVPEVLNGVPGCAVVSRDPRSLADAILTALNAGRPNELRARAEEYSRRRIAERLLAVYERLIAKKSR
jgi:teichuronic acid biosynthesis glycosyltransferase TuaC